MTNVAPPATTWVGGQDQEYTATTPFEIADSSSDLLVDSSGVFIVDNGVTVYPLPSTTWVEDETQ